MAQTTYNTLAPVGIAGLLERGSPDGCHSAVNEESSDVEYGTLVKAGAAERGFATLDAVSDAPLGVLVHQNRDPSDGGLTGLPADSLGSVCYRGDIWVKCEEAIALGDRVFSRAVIAGAEVPGTFRNDADGVAQVTTVTPTAENSVDFSLSISVKGSDGKVKGAYSFKVTGDADCTATELCDDFRTAMQAHTEFNALVTSSGTATLILTAVDKSDSFEVNDGGSAGDYASITETVASAPDCIELLNAEWLTASVTGADGNTVAKLRLQKL